MATALQQLRKELQLEVKAYVKKNNLKATVCGSKQQSNLIYVEFDVNGPITEKSIEEIQSALQSPLAKFNMEVEVRKNFF